MTTEEVRDDTGRLVSVVVDGQRFHRADEGELNTSQRLIVAEQLAREALAENAELRGKNDRIMRNAEATGQAYRDAGDRIVTLTAEVRSLRGVVQALEALKRPILRVLYTSGEWTLHDEFRAALAAAADAPQPKDWQR